MDGGESWTAPADLLPNIAVGAMAMDPSDSRVLYAGTGEGHFRGAAVRLVSDQPGAVLLLRGTIPPAQPMLLFQTPAIAVGPRR